jgi:hypothetical protein
MSAERELLSEMIACYRSDDDDDMYYLIERAEKLLAKRNSLRDYFAGLAMQGILTTLSKEVNSDLVAQMAYNMAGAMLKERKRERR